MQSLGQLLVCCVLLAWAAPTARSPTKPGAELQDEIESFAFLKPAAQQRWLSELFQRMDTAGRLVLSAEDLDRQRAYHAAVLARIAAGKELSSEGLLKLRQSADRLEHSAVEHLARLYRVEVYKTYRTDRPEYDRRIAAWRQTLLAWELAGRLSAEQPRLIAWLRSATETTAARQVNLPLEPKFGVPDRSPPQVAHSPSVPSTEPFKPATPPVTEKPTPSPAESLPAPRVDRRPPVPRPAAPAPARRAATEPPVVSRPIAEPLLPAAPPKPKVVPAKPRREVSPAAPRIAQRVGKRQANGLVAPAKVAVARQAGAEPARPTEHETETLAAQIDLGELNVRVTAYNLAMSALTAQLQDTTAWQTERLESVVEELTGLATRRGDLLLYWNLIDGPDRAAVGKLEPPSAAISLLGAKIFAARQQAGAAESGESPRDQQAELQRLDELSRRLAELALNTHAGPQ
jgi:hypothetical protein